MSKEITIVNEQGKEITISESLKDNYIGKGWKLKEKNNGKKD